MDLFDLIFGEKRSTLEHFKNVLNRKKFRGPHNVLGGPGYVAREPDVTQACSK